MLGMKKQKKSQSRPDQEKTMGALLRRPYMILSTQVYGYLATHGYADIRPTHSMVFRHIQPEGSRIKHNGEELKFY